MSRDTSPFLQRLQRATNDHDLDALVDCFAASYRNQAPAHPSRDFDGPGQVRSNWEQIFAFVPDVHATVIREATAGSEVWSEWEMTGTRLDGTRHHLRGVIVFTVEDDRAVAARFYLEPVDETATTVDEAVTAQTHAGGSR